mmetsp:Transcript_11419/g.24418  ORF Transcript_11419/g.24418 Transcript_11419/m.24418 type:complete len:353 (-) Transcript_11419:459-1517(-)
MVIGDEGRDIIFYLLLLVPLEFIMTSPRVVKDGNRRKAVALSGGLLAIVASVKIGWELMNKEQSYYDMMDVLPSASLQEIKKGYKTASLRVHPDKLAAAGLEDEGDEAFLALKAAYDVLYDSHLRDLYNKFGPPGIENKNDTNGLLAGLGFFYIVWLAVAYLLTRRKSVAHAQTWSFTGLLALGIFEYQACILSFDFLEEALPHLAMFEKIALLHRLYPVYLLGARMVAYLIYEDVDTYNAIVLQRLHAKTDMLLLMIRDNYLAASNRKQELRTALPPPADPDASPWGVSPEVLQQSFRPLHPAMAGQSAEAARGGRGRQPPQQQKGGRGISSLIWFFGVYFFFQWLVGRGS